MDKHVVTISEGKIKGETLKSVLGVDYLAFEWIPYAQPPIGSLRFKKPQPPLKWSGVRDVSKNTGDVSLQLRLIGQRPYNMSGSEDCLYLSVYTNDIGYKRPVMFYVHGGAYVECSTQEYCNPDYLITADIVYVSANYRLGPMGFLSVGHEVASGNQGIRDIICALRWVQQNIEAFGGDPNNVTIFGNSVGSVICQLFTLIPVTRGLFHKAILQSGSIYTIKDLIEGYDFKNGFKMASLFGMDTEDPVKAIEFLRSIPAKDLVAKQNQLLSQKDKLILGHYEYGPIFDGNYTSDPVVPVPFRELLRNDADIPIIIGNTSDECVMNFRGRFTDEFFKLYHDNIQDVVKNTLRTCSPEEFSTIMTEFDKFYLKNEPINKDNVWNLIRLLSDISYINYSRRIIDIRNEFANAPTYVYCYSYVGNEPTIYNFDKGPQPLKGAAHADEVSYLFYLSYMRKLGDFEQFPKEGTRDRRFMEKLIRLWSNFAATGNPTPPEDDTLKTIWKPTSQKVLYYLDIGEELKMRTEEITGSRAMYEKFKQYFLI